MFKNTMVWCAWVVFCAWQGSAMAGQLSVSADSRLWLVGDSTLHHYRCDAKEIQSTMEYKGSPDDALQKKVEQMDVTALTVTVPVKKIKSDSSGLDDNMYKALKANQFTAITFVMSKYEMVPPKTDDKKEKSAGNKMQIKVHGKLSIAGKEQEKVILGTVDFDQKKIRIKGQTDIDMTHFGIKPPSVMFGTITADKKITIHYDISWVDLNTEVTTEQKTKENL